MVLDQRLRILMARFMTVFIIARSACSDKVPFWNSSNPDWPKFQADFCGFYCVNGSTFQSHYGLAEPECYRCTCDERCSSFGTCCPEYDPEKDKYAYRIETSKDKNPNRWYERIACYNPPSSSSEYEYFGVISCPLSWRDNETRQKCEHPTLDSFNSVTPFSDRDTGLVFPNAYCAICNGIDIGLHQMNEDYKNQTMGEQLLKSVNRWSLKIKCQHYQNLYEITDDFELYKHALMRNECRVNFVAPKSFDLNWCKDTFDVSRNPEPNCTSPDETLAHLCLTLPPFPTLAVPGGVYRNMFCLMCTGVIPFIHYGLGSSYPHEVFTPPMFVLFGVGQRGGHTKKERPDEKQSDQCKPGQWRRKDSGECEPARCTSGKILTTANNTTTCTTAISGIKGLGYAVHLVIKPRSILVLDKHSTKKLNKAIRKRLSRINKYTVSSIRAYRNNCTTVGQNGQMSKDKGTGITDIDVSMHNIARSRFSRDEFEEELVERLLHDPWDFGNLFNNNDSVSFDIVCIGREMCELYRKRERNRYTLNRIGNLTMYVKSLEEFDADSTKRLLWLCGRTVAFVTSAKSNLSPDLSAIVTTKAQFIQTVSSLTCPFFAFNFTQNDVTENESLSFNVVIRDEEIIINTDDDNVTQISILDGKLAICLDLLKELSLHLEMMTSETIVNSEFDDMDQMLFTISYYIEITCLIISVLCLLVSFATYCIFPSLRSLPGLNNMCLCLILATAHICLIVVTVFGVKGKLHPVHCLIHAVIFHYSWMSSFCWMNICCIHMFRVFTSTRGPGVVDKKKNHLHYCLYAFGFPAFVVVMTMTITYLASRGESIGYDDAMCILDVTTSTLIIILSLLVPFCITMVTNFILFFLTIKTIIQITRHTPTSTKKSHGVIAYVKLSTLTGLFCAMAATAVLLRSPVLSLISGPLAALQGVFIFVSFTATKQVRQMLIIRIRGSDSRERYTTQTNTERISMSTSSLSTKVSTN